MAGDGDLLPVSALPVDGTFPTGTTKYEKRAIAQQIPVWDETICIDCGKCAMVCPHAAIRMKVYPEADVPALAGFLSKEFKSRDLPGHRLTIQVAPDDCTGCGVCVDVCPAKSKTDVGHKSINMEPTSTTATSSASAGTPSCPSRRSTGPHPARHREGREQLEPLFEFSGACAGCGETPYLRLVTQLFGDRMIVANATGCSSIYGANLPTTPCTVNAEGRGPAWPTACSRTTRSSAWACGSASTRRPTTPRCSSAGSRRSSARPSPPSCSTARRTPSPRSSPSASAWRSCGGSSTASTASTRRTRASCWPCPRTSCKQGVWIIGGDGWAYDIGFGGLDQVLSSGQNVNILVLDTEVYSNTGGQASKATPRGAVAKFAAAGKCTGKKDLGAIARAYGNVFVAQISLGANDAQSIKALIEAEAWPGPSLVIAYSTCIAHGIDMSRSMTHQKDAVKSGYWPLYRFQPSEIEDGTAVQARQRQAVDADQRSSWRARRGSRSSSAPTRSGPPSWRS